VNPLGLDSRFHGNDRHFICQGFKAKGGTIVDGSFMEVPKQRNTKEENEQIKNGERPESFSSHPHVLLPKDTDARWTKNGVTYVGYKDHVLADK